MTLAPKLSVLVPAFNQDEYVAECLSAVLGHDDSNFELIVVNDGSTDNTDAVLATFDDPRLKIITQSNRGVSAARNTAFEHASGEFILPLDADDIPVVENWHHLLRAMEAHPATVVTFGDSILFSSENSAERQLSSSEKAHDRTAPILTQLLCRNFMSVGAALIRADALRRAGLWNENLSIGEDWEMWCRLACVGQFTYVPVLVLKYRQHGRSAMGATIRYEPENTGLAAVDSIFSNPSVRQQRGINLQRLQRKAVAWQTYHWGTRLIGDRAVLAGSRALCSAALNDPMYLMRMAHAAWRLLRRIVVAARLRKMLLEMLAKLRWIKAAGLCLVSSKTGQAMIMQTTKTISAVAEI